MRLRDELRLGLLLLLLLLLLCMLSIAQIARGRFLQKSGDVHGRPSRAVSGQWTLATGTETTGAARMKADVVVGEGKGREI
jgi:hypothetical protein